MYVAVSWEKCGRILAFIYSLTESILLLLFDYNTLLHELQAEENVLFLSKIITDVHVS